MNEFFTAEQVDIPHREILRYLGYKRSPAENDITPLIQEGLSEFNAAAAYKACRSYCQVARSAPDVVKIDGLTAQSRALYRHLQNCDSAFLFAATTGVEVDRLIRRRSIISPARAVILDAIASAAIEAWCDQLGHSWRQDLVEQELYLLPRFSPGYGDLPLALQPRLLQLLDAERMIGLSLTESDLMIPQKSVSAIIGISHTPCLKHEKKCGQCSKTDCAFRTIDEE